MKETISKNANREFFVNFTHSTGAIGYGLAIALLISTAYYESIEATTPFLISGIYLGICSITLMLAAHDISTQNF